MGMLGVGDEQGAHLGQTTKLVFLRMLRTCRNERACEETDEEMLALNAHTFALLQSFFLYFMLWSGPCDPRGNRLVTSGVNGGISREQKEAERDNEREGCKITGLVQEAEGKIHVPTLPKGTKLGRKSRVQIGQNMMIVHIPLSVMEKAFFPCFLVGMWSS